VRFEIQFYGHENIRSLHQKTIEITKDSHLTEKGDCIIGVKASSACNDIPIEMKKKLQDSNSIVKFSILVNSHSFQVTGKGNNDLVLTHQNDIVIRKSNFICPRTMAVSCDNASDSIPREIVKLLQDPTMKGTLVIEV